MKRKEFKEKLFDALKSDVDNVSYDEKMILVNNLLIDFEKENEHLRDTSNKGQKWKDEELKIILSDAPSKANCIKYARLFKRGYGSIEQIYRWSTTSPIEMSDERKKDSFICQIKKVAKELMTGIFCHVISFRRLFLPIPVYSDASFTVRAFFVCIVFCVCSVKDSPFFFPQKERFFIVLIYALLFFVHLPPFY